MLTNTTLQQVSLDLTFAVILIQNAPPTTLIHTKLRSSYTVPLAKESLILAVLIIWTHSTTAFFLRGELLIATED